MQETGPKKGPNLLIILGAGCLLFGGLAMCGVIGGAVYLGNQAKQAMKPFQENPQRATMEWVIKANPELELVRSDDTTITVKEKASGKVATFTYDDIANGRMQFTTEEGEKVSIEAKGQDGDVSISSPDGEVRFSAGASEGLPDWIPAFPEATEGQSMFTSTMGAQTVGSYQFKTTKSVDEILAFYEGAMSKSGFSSVATTKYPEGTEGPRATGSFADAGGKRFLTVTISDQGGETVVMLSHTVAG